MRYAAEVTYCLFMLLFVGVVAFFLKLIYFGPADDPEECTNSIQNRPDLDEVVRCQPEQTLVLDGSYVKCICPDNAIAH